MAAGPRPDRQQALDFAGRPISLPEEPESWQKLKTGPGGLLLLGTGPGQPQNLAFIQEAIAAGKKISWLGQPGCSPALPEIWQKLSLAEACAALAESSVYFYRAGLRISPDFWGPILAKAAVSEAGPLRPEPASVWLPGNQNQLLHPELLATLINLGHAVIDQEIYQPDQILAAWKRRKPEWALSVNFRGLDPEGRIFELCRELGIPLAIWLVDNPWNLLSGVRLPWWKEANLFVTDRTFNPDLQKLGAKHVCHLPLAAAPHMFSAQAGKPLYPLFIGRSAFPDQKRFFAGVKLPADLLQKAALALQEGIEPDFHWWQKNNPEKLWPGNAVRKNSYGADIMSAQRRAAWIGACLASGLRIIGDPGWNMLLPGASILEPVDYYGALPDLYASADWTLNVTSLLLPGSLNQRHFDVWAAGGFLLTDRTQGMDLFPRDLAEQVAVAGSQDLPAKIAQFAERPGFKRELAREWAECIRARHTYADRLRVIARELGILLPAEQARRGM